MEAGAWKETPWTSREIAEKLLVEDATVAGQF
jgi:hypothetical protein